MRTGQSGRPQGLRRAAVGLVVAVVGLIPAVGSSQARSPIKIGQAASTPKTLAQCKHRYKHNKKARVACERRVRHKGSATKTGCTLEVTYNTLGDTGDTKDLKVGFKAIGNPGPNEPITIQVEVTVLNPKVTLCRTRLEVTEPGNIEKNSEVAIGPHGGVSPPITIPANAIPVVKALAKMG